MRVAKLHRCIVIDASNSSDPDPAVLYSSCNSSFDLLTQDRVPTAMVLRVLPRSPLPPAIVVTHPFPLNGMRKSIPAVAS